MLTSGALSIKFHIILVIELMTIQVFYISIIFYKLLPMCYDSCFIYQYHFISFNMFHACIFQKTGYEKEMYVPEGTITIRDSDLYLYYTI